MLKGQRAGPWAFVQELSILYLRCWNIFVQLVRFFGGGYLSILYLRCQFVGLLVEICLHAETFNSLFEMLKAYASASTYPAIHSLSILYLRCALQLRSTPPAAADAFNSLFEMPSLLTSQGAWATGCPFNSLFEMLPSKHRLPAHASVPVFQFSI